jgi:outer membrane protein OmpA-like peptidoglycan-associated protein
MEQIFSKGTVMRSECSASRIVSAALFFLAGAISVFAQDGKLTLHVTPKQAYIFVDDRAISEASKHRSLSLPPGEHKIELVNYGYAPVTRNVTITPGKTSTLEVALQPAGAKVGGPFGAIAVEKADRDAVLLNGKTPDFFVGHGDEFNTDFLWWKQDLVVPPGAYQVTVLGGDKEIWSGSVNVPANQRVIIDVPKGVKKTVSWKRGDKLSSVPRFTAGVASATVAIARPTAELSTTAAQLNCGDSSHLKWTSSDAPKVEVSPVGSVAASGEQSVTPTQTTTYDLTAVGPGGSVSSSVTVNVNSAVHADVTLSPTEVQYERVGDKIVENGSAALNWTATNASNVSIDPLGSVDASGSRTLTVVPQKSDFGPVNETVNYTLKATNQCGGVETRTVALHLVGSIEPGALSMRSVYFQTDLPGSLKSEAALLPSEKQALQTIAEEFKKYLSFKSDAHLLLTGYADKRGPTAYNQHLSERRAQLAKRFLIEQGVPEGNIETQAFGNQNNLTADQVKQLLDRDADISAEARGKIVKRLGNIVLAYNRRVDFTLSSTGQESAQAYPFNTGDFAKLADRNGPRKPPLLETAAQRERMGN